MSELRRKIIHDIFHAVPETQKSINKKGEHTVHFQTDHNRQGKTVLEKLPLDTLHMILKMFSNKKMVYFNRQYQETSDDHTIVSTDLFFVNRDKSSE